MARRHHHRRGRGRLGHGSSAGKSTGGGKRHHLLSSKGHRAEPFANKGGRYSTMGGDDAMHRPQDAPLVRSEDANFAGVGG